MATKQSLFTDIFVEFKTAQQIGLQLPKTGSGALRFPLLLATGDGTHFSATEKLLSDAAELARMMLANDDALQTAFSEKDFLTLVELSLGQAFQKASSGTTFHAAQVEQEFDKIVDAELKRRNQQLEIILGCTLIREPGIYPISIGPVTFHERDRWLTDQEKSKRVSKITARRIRRAWAGKKLGKRKSNKDFHVENSILESISAEPHVCVVASNGFSISIAKEKGLLCARMAMTAIALLWGQPETALKRMHLAFDGSLYHKRYAIMSEAGGMSSGSSISKIPGGYPATVSFAPDLAKFRPIFDAIGDALAAFLVPVKVRSPEVKNAIFLSLWWYSQGCREPSDHMAVTAFAASLDALAAGGKSRGIKEFIENRLGPKPSQKLLTSGETVNQFVDRVYDTARSRFIHGSSVDYVQDWAPLRAKVEAVGRLCLIQACDWVAQNPTVTDVKALREP